MRKIFYMPETNIYICEACFPFDEFGVPVDWEVRDIASVPPQTVCMQCGVAFHAARIWREVAKILDKQKWV